MFKNLGIGTKITALVTLLIVGTVVSIGVVVVQIYQSRLAEDTLHRLEAINLLKATQTADYLNGMDAMLEAAGANPDLAASAALYQENPFDDSVAQVVFDRVPGQIAAFTKPKRVHHMMVLSLDNVLLGCYGLEGAEPGAVLQHHEASIMNMLEGKQTSSRVYFEEGESLVAKVASLTDPSGMPVGKVLLHYKLDPLYKLIADAQAGLGESGESLVGIRYNNEVFIISPLKHDTVNVGVVEILPGEPSGLPMQEATAGNKGSGYSVDYRGEQVLAVWAPVTSLSMGVVSKIDKKEIFVASYNLIANLGIAGTILGLLSFFITVVFSRFLVNPIIQLKNTIELLGRGILPKSVRARTNDEVGAMAKATQLLVKGLRQTASFAQQIGKGDFDTKFKPMSENDTLGLALLNMKRNIQDSEKRDKERNWIVTGVAEVGEILRNNDELQKLGDEVVAYVTKKIGAVQGAFYSMEGEGKDRHLDMVSAYAYNKKKYVHNSFRVAEGLIGQAAAEKDTVLRTEIPRDYVTITSGLMGEQRPTCILVVPLITEEEVYGVVEFAGLERFTEGQVKFVEEISLISARTIFNIKVNERTRRLLAESQELSQELTEKQEVLRQNAEEMEATQEELQRTNQQLEDQISAVERAQKRQQLLLENASEVITIYEKDGTVRYISPSVPRILGYTQDELVGKHDRDMVVEETLAAYDHLFEKMISEPMAQHTATYEFKTKEGSTIWIESTGKNLLSDPSIAGLLVNSRDITERRRAEQEQRMRSKMQALSENSPDLITRLERDGEISYINPMIQTYFGHKPETFIHVDVRKTDISEAIAQHWIEVLEKVSETQKKLSEEMDFPGSLLGDRVMQVNAIPEKDENDQLESVLVVAHDITESKMIQLEIQAKNKKIADSINYAKRIQGAILPDNRVIRNRLPQSFMFYKAKDVVSGDFPWYLEVGDDLFIAAVDCTGHGVPGALISLIGYFLLNDIVRSQRIGDPGIILDMLDEGVTSTLRQDREDNQAKDGMDLALCKINKERTSVEFSGAHRPLYCVLDGEMVEIKGNKFAIGGGIYKNQTNFTNHQINVKPGDAIYFCSDGFPDQFGGPEIRKFGPRRTRELVLEVHTLPSDEQLEKVAQVWHDWQGEEAQIDDVLLIGINF